MIQRGRTIKTDKEKNAWLNKAIDIQFKILPGSKGLSLSKVRQKSPEKAIEMAEYLYKDAIERSNVEPLFSRLLKKIESFEEKDRIWDAIHRRATERNNESMDLKRG